jgi:dephospho-CoA kinase
VLRVGLTGGIASGKSFVAELFAELGVPIVDTDVIAREVVQPGSTGLAAVTAAFGSAVIAGDGSLDRRALRARIFADPRERARLDAIVHPLIRARAVAQLERLDTPYAIVVVPLLVETDFRRVVDRVLVVDCAPQTQIARVMARDRVGRHEAEAVLAAQASRADRLRAADDVIDNGGTPAHTREQVAALHARYLAAARDCPRQPGPAE